MILALALFGMIVGFAALWMAVQKRLQSSEAQLKESFQAISYEAMEKNARLFLDLAKVSLEKYQEGAKLDLESRQKGIETSLFSFKEVLSKIDLHQRELEKRREGAYAGLMQQIESMVQVERELRRETSLLAQSLRSPQSRGSWGEMHLRRVVELSGLLNHCDFLEQKHLDDGERVRRPDLVVRLPGQRQIVIDAKTPLHAYLDASSATDEAAYKKKLQEHAAALKKHIRDLSAREYWKQFDPSPEYVILFLPAEAFFSAALQADPSLIEAGADLNILIATPTTLIAILRAVALGWKQENLSKSAKEISLLGQELYDRIGLFCDHWNRVGKNLNTAVDSFNQSAASLESRVLVSVRKLKEAGQIPKELPDLNQVDRIARELATDTLIKTEEGACQSKLES